MYLDYAENQAARQLPMRMADWAAKLDAFLKFNEYEVLTTAGLVSAKVAKRLAEKQYAAFRIGQDQTFESDFEKEIKRIEQTKDEEEKGMTSRSGTPCLTSASPGGIMSELPNRLSGTGCLTCLTDDWTYPRSPSKE